MVEKIHLSGVAETMLQTIYARAKESKTRGAIKDLKAEEIIDNIDYNFDLANKDKAMHDGVIARTIVLDKLTSMWLKENKDAIIINIACGLDTRCYRMNGFSHWYNLDLPQTIEVRKKILTEEGNISVVAMSAMDDWGKEIKEENKPTLIIIEGLTMYLTLEDVQRIFEIISKRFENVKVFVEIMNPMVVKRVKEKSIEATKAKFTWGVKNGKALEKLLPDFTFIEEHSLCEGMAVFSSIYKLLNKISFVRNISNKIIVLEKKK